MADTNVIVSALVFGGLPRQILELVAKGICVLCLSEPIQAEVERILEAKFGWSPDKIRATVGMLLTWGIPIHPQVSLAVVTDDPDDGPLHLLAAALAAESSKGVQILLQAGVTEEKVMEAIHSEGGI